MKEMEGESTAGWTSGWISSYPCVFIVVDVVVVVVAGDVDLLLLQMSLAPEQRQK